MDESFAWEVLSRKTAYSCPGFDIEREIVRLPKGTETDFDFLVEPPSVVIIPFTVDGEIVLIREWREAVKRVNRGLPAGTAESTDEDLPAAAERELLEETGYVADRVEPLVTVEPANGVAAIEHHYFVAHDCEERSEQILEDDETIEVEVSAYHSVLADAARGDIRDGRTLLGLMYYEFGGFDTLTDDPGKPGT